MRTPYFAFFGGCQMTERQGALLVAHLQNDRPSPFGGRDERTVRSLVDRGWLRADILDRSTTLTERGRRAAHVAAEAFARKLEVAC